MELRQLLTRYRIEWRDRGNNCSHGWINVACPLCGRQDPSFHMRISEEMTGFYCLRNPRHCGSAVNWLLNKLGIPYEALPKNIENKKAESREQSKLDVSAYNYFEPGHTSPEVYSYLAQRKFTLPHEVVEQFSLKVAPSGKWAARVIIPLTVGWTGRSFRSHIEPRYLAHTDESGFFLHGKGSTAILVEGPLDAMKLATAVSSGIIYIAMTSGYVSPAILYCLRERGVQTVYSLPDETVELSHRMEILSTLRSALPTARITDLHLPKDLVALGYKDAGEFSEDEARRLIYSLS